MRILALLVLAAACGGSNDDLVECDPEFGGEGLCEAACAFVNSGSTMLPDAPACTGHNDVGESFICEMGSVIETEDNRIGCCAAGDVIRFFEC